MSKLDLSLYLVTDRDLLPSSTTLYKQVEACLKGGVTVVQLREKKTETRDFVQVAREIHELTRSYNVPLIINDRLDVAQAIDAEGIHVGQDDMDVPTIRKIWGRDKIIGVSVVDPIEAQQAIKDEVDYVGIGAVFGTATKDLKHSPIGYSGVREILQVLHKSPKPIQSVAIGGINHTNAEILKFMTSSDAKKTLDGIAVVSCLIASPEPDKATKQLLSIWNSEPRWSRTANFKALTIDDSSVFSSVIQDTIRTTVKKNPLVHQLTNSVVQNISANITIAVGCSPVMSMCSEEFAALSGVDICGALINMGSPDAAGIKIYQKALLEYNTRNKPVVFDPVGAGASHFRKSAVKTLLNSGVFACIKGNPGEILTAAEYEGATMKGVDSSTEVSDSEKVKCCLKLAKANRTIVVMTGETDVIADADGHAYLLRNGSRLLAEITGSGCILGSIITGYLAANPENRLAGVIAAVLLYTKASEVAAANKPAVQGPGTFVPALLDALYKISRMDLEQCTESVNIERVW